MTGFTHVNENLFFAASFALTLLVVVIELAWLARRHAVNASESTSPHAATSPSRVAWLEVADNFNASHFMVWLTRGLEVALYTLVWTYASWHLLEDWPVWAQWVLAFIAWDACFYWMHRLHHRVPLLWAVHSVHHEGEVLQLSLGLRNHWLSSLTNFPFVVVLALVGVSPWQFLVVSAIHYSVQFFNHSATGWGYGRAHALLVSPATHRLHHARHAPYLDVNFGGTFAVWDRLWGSARLPPAQGVVPLGIDGFVPNHNPWVINTAPLRRWLGQRTQVTPPSGLASDQQAWHVGVGSLLWFVPVIGCVAMLHRANGWALAGAALLLTLGAVALGQCGNVRTSASSGSPASSTSSIAFVTPALAWLVVVLLTALTLRPWLTQAFEQEWASRQWVGAALWAPLWWTVLALLLAHAVWGLRLHHRARAGNDPTRPACRAPASPHDCAGR